MIRFQMGYIIKLDCYYPYNTEVLAIKGIERRRRQYVVQPSYKIESKRNAKRSEHCEFSKRSCLGKEIQPIAQKFVVVYRAEQSLLRIV